MHILEAADSIPLQDQVVSASCQVKLSGGTFGIGVYSWTGTADTVTSDLVSSWTAVPPTSLAASWTLEGSTTGGTASWSKVSLENVSIDTSSTNNVAVLFVYQAAAEGSNVEITQVNLVMSSTASDYNPPIISEERIRANRRYFRYTGNASGGGPQIATYASAGSEAHKLWLPFPIEMISIPTTAVGGTWNLVNCTGPTLANTNAEGTAMTCTSSGAGMISAAPNGTDDYLEFDAEL